MATHDYNMIIKFPGKIFQCNNETLEEVVTKINNINFVRYNLSKFKYSYFVKEVH